MKIAFTICSNNYWPQAKVLATSLLRHNPDYHFVVGLVDITTELIDYSFDSRVEVIPVDDLHLNEQYGIYDRYNIMELNTAVKASYIKHLKTKYPDTSVMMYFDPDIAVFENLASIEEKMQVNTFGLTPHIFTPIPLDGLEPGENMFLNFGIYNLGFLALSFRDPQVYQFLDWWEERTLKIGYIRPAEGIFVDQLWINYVPVFYRGAHILESRGMNMGPWNLHERDLTKKDGGKYWLANGDQLIFYHFSNYHFQSPGALSKYYPRYSFADRPIMKEMYDWYREELIRFDIARLSTVICYYLGPYREMKQNKVKIFLKRKFKKWLPAPIRKKLSFLK